MSSVPRAAEFRAYTGQARPDDTAKRRPIISELLMVPRLAGGILIVVICGFYVIAVLRILPYGLLQTSISAGYMLMLAVLQLYISRPSARPRSPMQYTALLAQACLAYLPLLEFQQGWVGQPGFLAGSALLVLQPRLAWTVFVTVAASMAAVQASYTGQALDIAYITVSTIITGLMVYGLSRLTALVNELHAAQNELAQMAVAQERLRFSRDLHDLLGYSLSAITLKSELTHRLVMKHPERAQEELAEVLDISRGALADVRSVASGYRELSLDKESESARSVLLAADVDVRMHLDYGELPMRVRTVLATVLREGITNVLRHSKAEHCEITVRQEGNNVRIDIVNDGVPAETDRTGLRGGSGIANLSARVAALDGQLTAGLDPDGRFRLHATAPVSRSHARRGIADETL